MLRLALVAVVALVLAPSADAWSWPGEGSVLRPFSLVDDPYAGGQHRGIDVGCGAGASVDAPASGTVTFVGSLPGMGRGVTIQTGDGYAVTLVQLRATAVSRGDVVAEGAAVGAVGESEDPVTRAPHVHLGVRVASDPHGYVDPLSLLPRRPASVPPASAAPPPAAVPQPGAKPSAPAAPSTVQAPAAAAPAQPTVLPVAVQTPQPAAAVAAAPTPADPVQIAEPVAPADAAPVSTTAVEGRAGGLEVTASASDRAVATEAASVADVSSRRTADSSRGAVELPLTTPAAVHGRDTSSAGSGSARTGSAHELHAVPPPSRLIEPRLEVVPTERLVAGEPREPLLRPVTVDGSGRLGRWWLVASLAAAAAAVALGAARIMTARVRVPVRRRRSWSRRPGRTRAHRATSGMWRGSASRGHLRALPPPAGQRRPHGAAGRTSTARR